MIKLKENKEIKSSKDGHFIANPMTKKNKLQFALVPKSSLIVVDMQLNTGDFEFFVVKTTKRKFELFGKMYLVDDTFLVYNRSFRMYVGKYHENLSIPVKQHIPVNEIKEKMKGKRDASYSRVINNVEPEILKTWNTSKVIQDNLKGQALGSNINKITIMLWVIGIIALITMLIALNMSGLLNG